MCERAAFTQATGGQGRRPRQQAGSHPDSEGPWDLRKGAKLSKTSDRLQGGLHSYLKSKPWVVWLPTGAF